MILFLAVKLLLVSLVASSLFVWFGFLHQRRKEEWKKLAAMTSTRFVSITPDNLLLETGRVDTVSRISRQINMRVTF
jgi:hypothetical protein